MAPKTITKAIFVAAIALAGVAQAQAYSIHVKNGVYTIECDNGVRSQGSYLQVTHANAAFFCKVRGSSITDGSSGGGGGETPIATERSAR